MASSNEGAAQSDSEVSSNPSTNRGARTSDSGRGYTSDSELYETSARHPAAPTPTLASKPSWILMDEQTAAAATASAQSGLPSGMPHVPAVNPYSIVLQVGDLFLWRLQCS